MKVRHLRACASALAIGCALVSWEAALAAEDEELDQVAQNQVDDQEEEDVIRVIGSLIATTPEDAAKPVEVYTRQDLIEQGGPDINEFIQSLSVNTSSALLGFGETNPDIITGSGFNSFDLRGLGSNASLVLFNGRRLATTNGGFGADLNTLPMEALQSAEILRDGSTSTYGAGAVAGVANFTTRRDIDGPEITIERTLYDGSDGEYKIDFLTGWVGDSGNVMISLSHQKEDSMLATERDFSSQPFLVNPSGWSLRGTNPGNFRIMNDNYTTITGTVSVGSDFLDSVADNCEVLGGTTVSQLNPGNYSGYAYTNACAYPDYHFNELVSENTLNRIYAETNFQVTPAMEAHFDVLYSKSDTIALRPPSGSPSNRAISNTNPNGSNWGGCDSFNSGDCYYFIPTQVNYFDAANPDPLNPVGSVRNPFIDDFNTRNGVTVPDNGGLFTTSEYAPFLFGGHPLYGNGLSEDQFTRERLQINSGLRGQFTENALFGFLNGVGYDFNGQFNQYTQTNIQPDIIVSRLHAALNGYGGIGCEVEDLVPTDYSSAGAFLRTIGIQTDQQPGTGGCQWFNPFSSNFESSIINGAANPNFNAGAPMLAGNATPRPDGYLNPVGLIDWMTGSRLVEDQYTSGTFDFTVNGVMPDSLFSLPGGAISWAAGGQWRMVERRSTTYDPDPDKEAFHLQECPFPDSSITRPDTDPGQQEGNLGCDTDGAYYSSNVVAITGVTPPGFSDSQVLAFYGEVQLPVTDRFNVQLSARRESFNGGDVVGDTYNVAGKYDLTDNIYIRASYGTAFRAEEALDFTPGETDTTAVTDNNRFSGPIQYQRDITVALDLGPEDDSTFNAGVGYQGDVLGGYLRAGVDFFEILINDEVTLTSNTTVLNDVFPFDDDPLTVGVDESDLADCSANLISFVTFASGCTAGTTTGFDLRRVQSYRQNGPGFITNGFDYSIDYSHPLFSGDASLSIRATENRVYKAYGYDVNGIQFESDDNALIGELNTFDLGSASAEWRGSATVRWRNEQHNVNVRANYVSGMLDDRSTFFLEQAVDLIGVGSDAYSNYGREPEDYIDYDINYFFTPNFIDGLELRGSVLNVTDEDPPAFQSTNGYIGIAGNPRGRRIEVAVTKRF